MGISGWLETNLMEKVQVHIYVQCGLVILVYNEPMFPPDCDWIPLKVESGKQHVIEEELVIIGFDSESLVYAVRFPCNY